MGEAAFDDPALAPKAGSVFDAAAGDHRLDAARPEQASVLVVVIAAIGQHEVGLLSWPPWLALDRPGVQLVQQRDELGDVVAVAARERDGERDAGGVDEEVVLGARAGTIDGGWPGQEPPKSARTWLPSTDARDQSIAPTAFSLVSSR